MTAQCPKKDITIAWIMITHGHDILPQNNSLNNLWRYPIEGKGVSEAYPDYLNWTSASGHHINWLDKQNSAYIY